jgi:dolichyl-phosphate-mannose--protein O-mannosyl transferase
VETTEATGSSEIQSRRASFDLDIKSKPADGWAGWRGPLLATGLAALLRLPFLGQPHAVIFDETYYVKDSLSLLSFGHERKVIEDADAVLLASGGDNFQSIFTDAASYIVHPPVGKWIIASGEAIFGATPFGWRIAIALLGILSVLLTARIARRLTNSNFIGTVAGLLLALDGLHIAMSRTALLDTSLSFFVLAAFGFLIIDRDSANSGGSKFWRWVMVLCLGLACATKWSGVYFAAAFGVMMLVWDYERRRKNLEGFKAWLSKDFGPALLMPFAIIAIYISSWVGWFRSSGGWNRNWAEENDATSWIPDALISLFQYHKDMLSFHANLVTPHSYASNPWTWPLMIRPTSFHYETAPTCGADKCSQEVIPLGNPLIWWAGAIAIAVIVYFAVARRHSAALPIAVAFAAGWVPWLFFTQRTTFSFYSVVFIPYTVMALALMLYLLNQKVRSNQAMAWRWPTLTFLLVAAALTVFFYPILTGHSITYEMWQLRMWLPSWV